MGQIVLIILEFEAENSNIVFRARIILIFNVMWKHILKKKEGVTCDKFYGEFVIFNCWGWGWGYRPKKVDGAFGKVCGHWSAGKARSWGPTERKM